uniref:Ig-like domain-containing protein n=1 Tax=Astyanax mexicanus TaxID=7994 RepID=A0A3B1K026_ASTMX
HLPIYVAGRSSTVTVGEDAILFCQLIGTTERLTRITWQRRTHTSSTNENIFVIIPYDKAESVNGFGDRIEFVGNTKEYNGTVRMKNVTSLDHQIYTCIFNIFPSGPFEKEINLNVYGKKSKLITVKMLNVNMLIRKKKHFYFTKYNQHNFGVFKHL